MPELPEVETVKNTLLNQILNEKITSVDVYYDKMITPNSKIFCEKLKQETLRNIIRKGKYLIFIFDNVSVVSHLRMEGKYFIKHDEKIEKHEHIIFHLASSKTLRYHDTRKFGTFDLLETTNIEEILNFPKLKKQGMDANLLNSDGIYLYNKIKNLALPIKTVLLDQTVVSGIGNIYADEICFKAKIHPLTLCNKLTLDDAKNICKNAVAILNNAIEKGGTTIRSYTSSLGVTGRFQLELLVHTRYHEECLNCKTLIEKIKVGGRTSYYCPNCQKKNPYVIGITGSIATGKSSVVKFLKQNYSNITFIDADEIVKAIYQTNSFKNKIKEEFGINYLKENNVNRKLLAELIFNNENEKFKLNSIIHPLVKTKIKSLIKNTKDKLIIIDIPLLLDETKIDFKDIVDEIWLIYTNREEQLKRLMLRDNIDKEYANKKILSQLDIDTKKELISKIKNTHLFDNSNELCYTLKEVENFMNNKFSKIEKFL